MIELINGSLGEGQPNFSVIVTGPVSLDQVEQIAMFVKQCADDGRKKILDELTAEAQKLNMGY